MTDKRTWKEGVELFLDNRQIFMLFFASAVILSLVFALGVVVGKRAAPPAAARPAADPLALLDQMGGQDKAGENLSFHEELTTPKQASAPDAGPVDEQATSDDPPDRGAPAKVAEPRPVRVAMVKKSVKPAPAPAPSRETAPAREAKAAEGAPADDEDTAGTFSLQLSSFQDKFEAKNFIRKLSQAGMKPYLIPAKIPGRGIWFRVRLGAFKSWDEALSAKQSYEKQLKMIAYVAKN